MREAGKVCDPATAESGQAKLFHLADWLPPAFGATGQYALMFATERARAGRRVHLIGLTAEASSVTSQRFPGGGELRISRVRAREPNKTSNTARLAWSLLANWRLIWPVLSRTPGTPAEVLFTGSPPFMLYFAVVAKYLRGTKLTYRITDFYPEVVMAALPRGSLALSMIGRLTWFLRRRVDRFEVLGEDQRRILLEGGVAGERILLVRDRSPVDFAAGLAPRPRPPELGGRFALLYSGNYGVAHEVDTIVKGLALHHGCGSDRFALWINGSGVNAAGAAASLGAAGAPVARTPPAPLGDLASLLVSADAHLIALRAGFAGLVLPSKVYGCIASGKPILFVGPAASDVHLLCSEAQGAWYRRVEPGDVDGFRQALEALADFVALGEVAASADASRATEGEVAGESISGAAAP